VVEIEEHFLNAYFRVVNVYGPYAHKVPFWEGLSKSSALATSNIILGGDLNFMLFIREVWGSHPRKYAHEGFFEQWITKTDLIDLEPTKLPQT
jgi:hypothetical protein